MTTKPAYQADRAGMYLGPTVADESPLEPGTYYPPAGAVLIAPPEAWPDDKWPRWNGKTWDLVNKPRVQEVAKTSVEKLQAFLAANPDVAGLVGQGAA